MEEVRAHVGPKYQQVYEALERDILDGKYRSGQKLPSEALLVKQFGASRITVGRAVRDLRAHGLVERRAGSGTYVRSSTAKAVSASGLTFGLLIPDLGETEIFEPIREGLAGAPGPGANALLWGAGNSRSGSKADQACRLAEQYVARQVAGVFFAPLELTLGKDEANRRIVDTLNDAGIPIVLLDRCYLPYPRRSPHDLIGIDNRRAAYLATEHLVNLGRKRIAFVARPDSASTVGARIAGYREALAARDMEFSAVSAGVAELVGGQSADALVCANDRTAGEAMQTLIAMGIRIPQDVAIVGMDDVEYARLLPVPLTTMHQPCREIGEAAMSAMMERVARPDMPARDILLDCRLIVRASCGARLIP